MIYVIDASTAIKWFAPEPLHQQALWLLENATTLAAPDFLLTEVANIAWKKAIRGELASFQARAIPSEVRDYIPDLHPSPGLIAEALEMAISLRHPVYDCLYLACAEAAGGVLVTADMRLRQVASAGGLGHLVRSLEEFGAPH